MSGVGAEQACCRSTSTLPGPRPVAGKLVTVTWALELVADEGERFVRLDLPLEPLRAG